MWHITCRGACSGPPDQEARRLILSAPRAFSECSRSCGLRATMLPSFLPSCGLRATTCPPPFLRDIILLNYTTTRSYACIHSPKATQQARSSSASTQHTRLPRHTCPSRTEGVSPQIAPTHPFAYSTLTHTNLHPHTCTLHRSQTRSASSMGFPVVDTCDCWGRPTVA